MRRRRGNVASTDWPSNNRSCATSCRAAMAGRTIPETGEYALFLECVSDMVGLDATGATADWEPEAIDAALHAAARWHSAFWGADEKRLGWAGPRPTTASMVADTSLWRGLLNDARARFPHIVTQEVWRRRYALIDTDRVTPTTTRS